MTSPTRMATMAQNLSNMFKAQKSQTSSSDENAILASQRVSSVIAAPLLAQMNLTEKTSEPICVLESACGTGVFVKELQSMLPRGVLDASSFTCADSSAGMVELVKKQVEEQGWVNTEAKVLDAMDTGLPSDTFSHVSVCLGLHLIPNPDAVLEDCKRILKPGGIFGATTFPTSNSSRFWFPDMRSAFASMPFNAPPLPDSLPMQLHDSGHWYDPEWIQKHLEAETLGFEKVQVKVVPGKFRVGGAAEFVGMFGMMLPWLMKSFWSEEMREAHGVEEVKGLIEKHLEEKYGGEGWELEWHVISMTAVVRK